MKVLIVSDSHMRLEKLISIYEAEKPSVVICAGDHSKDCQELSYIKEDAKYYIVKGNCDLYDYNFNDILEFDLYNYKFFLTHGHIQGVKRGYSKLKYEGSNSKANIVIFGHTHIPYYEVEEGIHYFNPGAAKDGRYGLLEIDEDKIEFKHKILN